MNDTPIVPPPIGLESREAHNRKRIKAIKEAICRYMDAQVSIPQEWIIEYNELIKKK